MDHRKMLYGYKIENGELCIHKAEAPIVHRVYTTYLAGRSYQSVADDLNADNIPYYHENPTWDKHKVKRMLENPRYTGKDGYPQIIELDTFQRVQQMIQKKSAGSISRKTAADAIWPRLRSRCCQERLLRVGGVMRKSGLTHLRCASCNAIVAIRTDELLAQTARQLVEHDKPESKPYAPSAEAIRLANAINRALENPSNGASVAALILQGASARYDCCDNGVTSYETNNHPEEVDWNRFSQVVSYITIEQDCTVTVNF